MADLDYKQLTHAQRLALFLIVIGPDAAAAVLRGFEDADAGAVCREMAQITVVPDHLQREAVAEFSEIISQNSAAVAGGLAYAHRTLGAAKGLGLCRLRFTQSLNLELVGVERVAASSQVKRDQLQCQLRASGQPTRLLALDHLSMNRGAARNRQHIADHHILADGEQYRRALIGSLTVDGFHGLYAQ